MRLALTAAAREIIPAYKFGPLWVDDAEWAYFWAQTLDYAEKYGASERRKRSYRQELRRYWAPVVNDFQVWDWNQ